MMDLFVSNDTVRNFLFLNRGNGKFEEAGEIAGVAYSSDGRARSGMGVDAADYDQDGFMDLFVANLDRQSYSIYRNNHDETFDDTGAQTGIAAATYLMSGWGLKFCDFDNDGILDLLLVNGNPDDLIDRIHSQVTYEERPLLFQGSGKGLRNISQQSGPIFEQPLSGRGLAVGDFNNDGAMDVLIGVNDGAPVLLRNTAAGQNHWLGIKLVGNRSNRDAVGARITYQAQDLKQSRMKVGGGSYLSSHDPRMVLGIGNRLRLDWVEIKWPLPGGKTERFTDLPIDRYITIIEGHAKWT
jgi:enediyne biosynthesis protein E4